MSYIDLAGLDRDQLAESVRPLALPRFVAGQLFRWLHARREVDFMNMTDLKLAVRDQLRSAYDVKFSHPRETHCAADGTTRYVFVVDDGSRIEAVRIPGEAGLVTLCLSSQVGCPLACSFCVSGLDGVKRNLTTAEILSQARAMLPAAESPQRVNIVFMGMGEALLNLANVARAIAILTDPDGFNIAPRRMTLSTAGHVPGIDEFALLANRPRLAISLNATDDRQRDELMPINRKWPLRELMAACRRFPLQRGEKITFEYVLLKGINDSDHDARRVPKLIAGIPAKVNLIPWNPAPGFGYERPSDHTVARFSEILQSKGLVATVRRQRGGEADAACGQLARHRTTVPQSPAHPP